MDTTSCGARGGADTPRHSETRDDGTIGSQSLSGFCELVAELGGDPELLLRHADLDPSILHESGARIALEAATELLELSARLLGRSDFGMRLAERQNPLSIPKPIDLLISNAPTVGEAMRICMCHIHAYTTALRVQLARYQARQLYLYSIEFRSNEFRNRSQIAEQLVFLVHAGNHSLTGGVVRPREIWFSHPRVGPASSYAKRFGVPVKFGQPLDGVLFSEAELTCKVINRDPVIFESECRKNHAEQPGIVSEVCRAIVLTLAEECCTRERVAVLLGMHPRTLQRRLFGSLTSFEELRDEVRRKLAARYLSRKDLSLIEIVNRLGYSEPAVLSRSCRRWFAASPTDVRKTLAWQEQRRLEGLDS